VLPSVLVFKASVIVGVHLELDFTATVRCMQHGIPKCLPLLMPTYGGSMMIPMKWALTSLKYQP
jgi:hypothetical protein